MSLTPNKPNRPPDWQDCHGGALRPSDTPNFLETGLTDKHLTFTIRVETTQDHVAVRTLNWFHSALGWVYLRVVLPAHNLILGRIVGSLAVVPS